MPLVSHGNCSAFAGSRSVWGGRSSQRRGQSIPSSGKLENDFERELAVEGFAYCDTGGAGAADCAGDLPGSQGIIRSHGPSHWDISVVRRGVARTQRWLRVVIPVEDVEHLPTELPLDPLCDGEVFEDGEVDVSEARRSVNLTWCRLAVVGRERQGTVRSKAWRGNGAAGRSDH